MSLQIDKDLTKKKEGILAYFRARAAEYLPEITQEFGLRQFRKRAASINRALLAERESVLTVLRQIGQREHWSRKLLLETTLLLMHCCNAVMLEERNEFWPYDYMAFSRRIGEIWEPFVTTCFSSPVREDIELFVPPLFKDIKKRLVSEVSAFIKALNIAEADKTSLLNYYDQVWQLVSSGETKLELDLHFLADGRRHVVDCKSGFGSNEKGNTNRLLLVASIYKNIEHDDYNCMIWVRSKEDQNNHYLQTLKNSKLWEVACEDEAYSAISKYSGFDLGAWIKTNIDWKSDFKEAFHAYLKKQDLVKYLSW